ncbi:hypothetical protein GCM10007887_14970 [Methylobacterium haplocladii]|uniref:Adenylate/guanylate cyclase domain-containing protein n=1 Tax=Methylobacterium haplocladii TaxID=1176176 RepID=A0A512IRP6_9HYPH|nr:hypothetical protein MHA02_27720 [Methylobacterium haplocladii]GLS58831.1 hypothetical protein GCM10007887_14970 [Methylobacterium haplocladii]
MEAWFGYRDRREQLHEQLGLEARAAAFRIRTFIDNIREQLGWMVQLSWTAAPEDRHRVDASRLLRQVPAIMTLALVDGDGRERLHVSRVDLNRVDSRSDLSADPAVAGARANRVWYGPVTYHRGSEPFVLVAVAGNRASVGVAVAEINLKLIQEVVSGIRVGETGQAFVLDGPGRLIAHPDINFVLRGADDPATRPLVKLRDVIRTSSGSATGRDAAGQRVIASMAAIAAVDWTVIVMLPVAEAFGPISKALLRTGALLILGALFAAGLAYWLARRMTGPIQRLEYGTEQIGAGHFEHRIAITSADELGRLAARFNAMAGELALSQERQERIARLKHFLAPQIAELVDRAGDDNVLDGQRVDVAVIFCDLRGFTAFSAASAPEAVMEVLNAYFEALGRAVTAHSATLISFTGDGLMAILNAPVRSPDPAFAATCLAIDMQTAVQTLIATWRRKGYRIGFGVGAAMGTATVGRIGYEERYDYTAIGPVVNLAARLCASAADAQILIDVVLAEAVCGRAAVTSLGSRPLKGLSGEVPIYAVSDHLSRGS